MPRDRRSHTYRVRSLPAHLGKADVAAFLSQTCKALGKADSILVFSLASSLIPFEIPRTRTATVVFRDLPSMLDNDLGEWTIATAEGQRDIIIDTHFLGFTALNDVDSDLHAIDCIAISGLASHPFGSWADRNEQSHFMWLRDLLPQDLKQARSIIYGYDTRLIKSGSFQSLQDLSLTLIAQMRLIGRALQSAKPAILLAHSLGGILVKEALLEMANSGEAERFMLRLIRQVIMFGVPNKGMEMEHWLPMVEGQPNESLIRLLAKGSVDLIEIDKRFEGIALHYKLRVVSFFETGLSQTAARDPSTQKWGMKGPLKVLVDRDSAIQSASQKSDILPINKSHSDIVKFQSGSTEYLLVVERIHSLASGGWLHLEENRAHQIFSTTTSLGSPRRFNEQLSRSILASLNFEDSQYRFKNIDSPYGSTFKWIWTSNDVGFSSWLEKGVGVYWISGKPGSGKSTLMKYIFANYLAKRPVRYSTSGTVHIHAGFFFHDRGSHIQKSLEGLHFSLLQQILVSEPRLIEAVSPVYLKQVERKERIQWSISTLQEALSSILSQNRLSVYLLLFLDALDEYDGRPESIISFIKHLVASSETSATRIRLCFSSRPWNIFTDNFKGSPGFKIHEQTTQDILTFIDGRFAESPSMMAIMEVHKQKGDDEFNYLRTGLVQGAQGVFLWLRFVMQHLLEESAEGATIAELLETLSLFPRELNDLYTRIVQRIPEQYRAESYAMLEIVLRCASPIRRSEFWQVLACSPCRTLSECVSMLLSDSTTASDDAHKITKSSPVLTMAARIPHTASKKTFEQEQRRITSRCGGLIEFVWRERNHLQRGAFVLQFMHQTVKDFIDRPGFRQIILPNNTYGLENGYSLLAKYGLTQIHIWNQTGQIPTSIVFSQQYIQSDSQYSAINFPEYFAKAELTTGTCQRDFLESSEEAFERTAGYGKDCLHLVGSSLSFSVVDNLQLYVKDRLASLDERSLSRVLGQTGTGEISLLHVVAIQQSEILHSEVGRRKVYAVDSVDPWLTDALLEKFMFDSITSHGGSDLTDMADLLLSHGADRDALYLSLTPFQWLFTSFALGNVSSLSRPTRVLHMICTFLIHGQDPDTPVWSTVPDGTGRLGCKPLHMADYAMALELLKHGANVNALDTKGRTALDIAFGAGDSSFYFRDYIESKENYRLILLLLDHGGRVTGFGLQLHSEYLTAVACHIPMDQLDQRLLDPPQLGQTSRQKSFSSPKLISRLKKKLHRR